MIIVTLRLAFKDDATYSDIKDWLGDIQNDVECMNDPPQCIFAEWPGNVYMFPDAERYAAPVWPEYLGKARCPHGDEWADCPDCRH